MSYELSGKLIAKFDTVQKSETFKTREFVIEKTEDINGRSITNFAKFQCVQDRTNIVDRFNVGDDVKVLFNIRGTKWEKNGQVSYFTNLDAWRIESAMMQGGNTGAAPDAAPDFIADQPAPDDLPF
jgi:hypothetical protein